jgi:methionyl-tRNA formyltransferase
MVISRTTLLPEVGAAKVEAGVVVQAGPEGIDVATAKGGVRILELTPAGKRPMSAAAFVNGYRVEPGARLASADQKVRADS